MMNKEETISEEQVLHNELPFEINIELIHLMKKIVKLQQENKMIDIIINSTFFKDECPLNFSFNDSDEDKAQDRLDENWCEHCNDDYKKCWIKYFKELTKFKGEE